MKLRKKADRKLYRAGKSLAALIENMEILTGQRGTDKEVITRSDIAYYVGQYPSSGTNGANEVIIPVQLPNAPTNFQGTGSFQSVLLTWDLPNFLGYAHSEIWRSTDDQLVNATLIVTTAATLYNDVVPSGGGVYYYWLRFVNVRDFTGPYYSAIGLRVETYVSVGTYLDGVDQTFAGINLNGSTAYQNMWAVKVELGEVTAGIGLIAGVDPVTGEDISVAVVSASQFYIYDPNATMPTAEVLFSVVDGVVGIREAWIQTAFISILTATEINADTVSVGIDITTPIVNGGTINGAVLNIGVGGPYNVQPGGGGYHFHVNSSGNLYAENVNITGHINATSGSFRSQDITGLLTAAQIETDELVLKGQSVIQKSVTTGTNTSIGSTYKLFASTRVNIQNRTSNTRVSAGFNFTLPDVEAGPGHYVDIQLRVDGGTTKTFSISSVFISGSYYTCGDSSTCYMSYYIFPQSISNQYFFTTNTSYCDVYLYIKVRSTDKAIRNIVLWADAAITQ